jgi:putative PEP-CTERM system TPR-repeat lipoprotein
MAGAQKLLGKILLVQGRADQALNVLVEAERKAPRDPDLLSLLASAYMARGLNERAAALLERAVEASQDPALRTQLGVARILAGDLRIGMHELDTALRDRPDDPRAGLLLALKLLEEGRGGEALERLAPLLAREPANPVLLNMRGVGLRLSGDLAAARLSFEAAGSGFLPARINLARLAEIAGDRAEARRQLETLAREHPDDRELLLARVRLERTEGRLGEAARLLDRLRTLNPDDIPIRIAQIELDLEAGDAARALRSAEELAARHPEALPVQETLGRSQVNAGQAGAARVTFRRMSDRAGFDARWQVRIAALQRGIGADDDARHSLQKAIQAEPHEVTARRDLAVLELDTGHAARALDLARALRQDFPEDLLARQLEADALLAQGDATAAQAVYAEVHAREPTLARAIGLARALAIQGDLPAATRLLGEWHAAHPDDDLAGLALAEFQTRAGQTAAARATYEALLARHPDDPTLLNNLAQLLAGEDDVRAVSLARRAVAQVATNADFLDTLGWLLVSTGAAEEGLRHLREARARAADNPTHAYHVAMALERLGRPEEARRAVEEALATGRDFPEREAARSLSQRLAAAGQSAPAVPSP